MQIMICFELHKLLDDLILAKTLSQKNYVLT